MALTVNKVLENMRHELGGGDLPIEIDKFQVLNEAGDFLHSMHPWKWAVGRSSLLNLRGSLDGTTATWTASTLTLTAASAFTNYSFLAGDELEIIDGTNATVGTYVIASRTSANAIVLASTISASNLTAGDIEWVIYPGTIDLPDDLRDIISIRGTSNSTWINVCLTSAEEIARLRSTSAVTQSPSLFYATLVYAGTPLAPILEIWPSASANATGALRIFYRSRWVNIYTDNATLAIPEFVESLYIWIVRAYASGYVRDAESSIHERLGELASGPIFQAAVRSDGQGQPFARIRNGGAMVHRHRGGDQGWLANLVEGPI